MLVRRTWIAALLAAVFLMHGIPSMATGGSAAPTAHAEMAGAAAVAGPSPVDVDHGPEAGPVGQSADPGTPSHTMTTHLWSACLAVLLMGMALLPAAFARKLTPHPVHRVASQLQDSNPWTRPLRPPDLAALCLLRT